MKIKRLVRIIVSVSLLTYLLTLLDISATIQRLLNIDLVNLIPAIFLLFIQSALSSFKWKLILAADSIKAKFLFLWGVYLSGNFFSLFLPTSFGGDIYRVYAISKNDAQIEKGAASVLFDRFTGLFALCTIGLIAYSLLPGASHIGILITLYVTGILALLFAASGKIKRLIKRLVKGIKIKWGDKALLFLGSLGSYLATPKTMVFVLAIAFTFQFNTIIINALFCEALGIEIPLSILALIVPLVYLTETLPISINGIGVRDGAFVLLFSTFGFASEDGLALAFLVLTMRYVVGLAGGIIFLIRK